MIDLARIIHGIKERLPGGFLWPVKNVFRK